MESGAWKVPDKSFFGGFSDKLDPSTVAKGSGTSNGVEHTLSQPRRPILMRFRDHVLAWETYQRFGLQNKFKFILPPDVTS